MALPGTNTTFYPDLYLVNTAEAESKWQYDKILGLAETVEYLVLVVGKNHALAMEKASLEGDQIRDEVITVLLMPNAFSTVLTKVTNLSFEQIL